MNSALRLACVVMPWAVVGCGSAHNRDRCCAHAVAEAPHAEALHCAPSEELIHDESPAAERSLCVPRDVDRQCREREAQSGVEPINWLFEYCRLREATQSLFIDYCSDGIEYMERTTRSEDRVDTDVVRQRGLGHGHASFPAACAMGRDACGPASVEYVESGAVKFRGAYSAHGHMDGPWVVRDRAGEEAHFELSDGNGTVRDLFGIQEMTCRDGMIDGHFRIERGGAGQPRVVLEAEFQDGIAHGAFHTTLVEGTNTYDIVLGQYTNGVPSGLWTIESHGDRCALEEGDCAIQCVDYVRTGPAVYEYNATQRQMVRATVEVTEPFRAVPRIESGPFSAEEHAEPLPFHDHLEGGRISCMDVIRSVASLDSPGIHVDFLRGQEGGATELMRVLESLR